MTSQEFLTIRVTALVFSQDILKKMRNERTARIQLKFETAAKEELF
jgi:hypothetical protein